MDLDLCFRLDSNSFSRPSLRRDAALPGIRRRSRLCPPPLCKRRKQV